MGGVAPSFVHHRGEVFMTLFVGLMGLLVGGFLNSFAYRVEKSKNFLAPISCRHCHHTLIWIDIIPVLSWIIFKRKCRYCKGSLTPLYPLVELFMMVYCLMLYVYVPLGFRMGLMGWLGFCVVALSLVDIRSFRLPNNLIVMLGIAGILWCFSEPTQAFVDACILAIIGMGLKIGFEKVQKIPSLGWGDVKLMAISGLWIDTYDIPLYLIVSGILGVGTALIWEARKKSKIFPFAPALSAALLITVWWRILG